MEIHKVQLQVSKSKKYIFVCSKLRLFLASSKDC